MATGTGTAREAVRRRMCDTLAAGLGLAQCQSCATITTYTPAGHPALCEACTCAELGLSVGENAARIGLGWTVAQFLAWPVDEPLPFVKSSPYRRRVGR